MKKSITALALTVMFCFVCIISASAVSELSPDEALTRKRAYYAGINNSVALLSKNIGPLENVQIKRIVVLSPTDFTSEAAVKDKIISSSHKFIPMSLLCVYIQFSASDGNSTQDYLFSHFLASASVCSLSPMDSSSTEVNNYNAAMIVLDRPDYRVASGIAHTDTAPALYYLDIDLSDYQSAGYSLSVPISATDNDSSALFPLIRKRAYYAAINDAISHIPENAGSLKDIQIKRVIISSFKDFTSAEAVSENILTESQKKPMVCTVTINIQLSASDGSSVQDYLFGAFPARSSYRLYSMTSSESAVSNYIHFVSYLEDYGRCIAPGIAYLNVFGNSYYLDIDLNDYQSSGYSLLIAD
ncbi:MAG: hypothetical protein MR452_07935 [Faecalibacterium prausnitzii]|nr:hypothetical protein [Faecalibacterium prausnitzii]